MPLVPQDFAGINKYWLGEHNSSRRTVNSPKCPESISYCDGLRSPEESRRAVRNKVRGWAGPKCGLGRRAEGSGLSRAGPPSS